MSQLNQVVNITFTTKGAESVLAQSKKLHDEAVKDLNRSKKELEDLQKASSPANRTKEQTDAINKASEKVKEQKKTVEALALAVNEAERKIETLKEGIIKLDNVLGLKNTTALFNTLKKLQKSIGDLNAETEQGCKNIQNAKAAAIELPQIAARQAQLIKGVIEPMKALDPKKTGIIELRNHVEWFEQHGRVSGAAKTTEEYQRMGQAFLQNKINLELLNGSIKQLNAQSSTQDIQQTVEGWGKIAQWAQRYGVELKMDAQNAEMLSVLMEKFSSKSVMLGLAPSELETSMKIIQQLGGAVQMNASQQESFNRIMMQGTDIINQQKRAVEDYKASIIVGGDNGAARLAAAEEQKLEQYKQRQVELQDELNRKATQFAEAEARIGTGQNAELERLKSELEGVMNNGVDRSLSHKEHKTIISMAETELTDIQTKKAEAERKYNEAKDKLPEIAAKAAEAERQVNVILGEQEAIKKQIENHTYNETAHNKEIENNETLNKQLQDLNKEQAKYNEWIEKNGKLLTKEDVDAARRAEAEAAKNGSADKMTTQKFLGINPEQVELTTTGVNQLINAGQKLRENLLSGKDSEGLSEFDKKFIQLNQDIEKTTAELEKLKQKERELASVATSDREKKEGLEGEMLTKQRRIEALKSAVENKGEIDGKKYSKYFRAQWNKEIETLKAEIGVLSGQLLDANKAYSKSLGELNSFTNAEGTGTLKEKTAQLKGLKNELAGISNVDLSGTARQLGEVMSKSNSHVTKIYGKEDKDGYIQGGLADDMTDKSFDKFQTVVSRYDELYEAANKYKKLLEKGTDTAAIEAQRQEVLKILTDVEGKFHEAHASVKEDLKGVTDDNEIARMLNPFKDLKGTLGEFRALAEKPMQQSAISQIDGQLDVLNVKFQEAKRHEEELLTLKSAKDKGNVNANWSGSEAINSLGSFIGDTSKTASQKHYAQSETHKWHITANNAANSLFEEYNGIKENVLTAMNSADKTVQNVGKAQYDHLKMYIEPIISELKTLSNKYDKEAANFTKAQKSGNKTLGEESEKNMEELASKMRKQFSQFKLKVSEAYSSMGLSFESRQFLSDINDHAKNFFETSKPTDQKVIPELRLSTDGSKTVVNELNDAYQTIEKSFKFRSDESFRQMVESQLGASKTAIQAALDKFLENNNKDNFRNLVDSIRKGAEEAKKIIAENDTRTYQELIAHMKTSQGAKDLKDAKNISISQTTSEYKSEIDAIQTLNSSIDDGTRKVKEQREEVRKLREENEANKDVVKEQEKNRIKERNNSVPAEFKEMFDTISGAGKTTRDIFKTFGIEKDIVLKEFNAQFVEPVLESLSTIFKSTKFKTDPEFAKKFKEEAKVIIDNLNAEIAQVGRDKNGDRLHFSQVSDRGVMEALGKAANMTARYEEQLPEADRTQKKALSALDSAEIELGNLASKVGIDTQERNNKLNALIQKLTDEGKITGEYVDKLQAANEKLSAAETRYQQGLHTIGTEKFGNNLSGRNLMRAAEADKEAAMLEKFNIVKEITEASSAPVIQKESERLKAQLLEQNKFFREAGIEDYAEKYKTLGTRIEGTTNQIRTSNGILRQYEAEKKKLADLNKQVADKEEEINKIYAKAPYAKGYEDKVKRLKGDLNNLIRKEKVQLESIKLLNDDHEKYIQTILKERELKQKIAKIEKEISSQSAADKALVAEKERLTKELEQNLKAQKEITKAVKEYKAQAQSAKQGPQFNRYSVPEIQKAIEATKKLRDEHYQADKTLGQQSQTWKKYNAQVEQAQNYLRALQSTTKVTDLTRIFGARKGMDVPQLTQLRNQIQQAIVQEQELGRSTATLKRQFNQLGVEIEEKTQKALQEAFKEVRKNPLGTKSEDLKKAQQYIDQMIASAKSSLDKAMASGDASKIKSAKSIFTKWMNESENLKKSLEGLADSKSLASLTSKFANREGHGVEYFQNVQRGLQQLIASGTLSSKELENVQKMVKKLGTEINDLNAQAKADGALERMNTALKNLKGIGTESLQQIVNGLQKTKAELQENGKWTEEMERKMTRLTVQDQKNRRQDAMEDFRLAMEGGRSDDFINATIKKFQQLSIEWEHDGKVATEFANKIQKLQTQLSANTEQKLSDRYDSYLKGNITSTEGIQRLMNDYKALRIEMENTGKYTGQFDAQITKLEEHLKDNSFEKRTSDLQAMKSVMGTMTNESLQSLINKYRQLIDEMQANGRTTGLDALRNDMKDVQNLMQTKSAESLGDRFQQFLDGKLTSNEGIQKLINDFKNLRAEMENDGKYVDQFENQIKQLSDRFNNNTLDFKADTGIERMNNALANLRDLGSEAVRKIVTDMQSLKNELQEGGKWTNEMEHSFMRLQAKDRSNRYEDMMKNYGYAMSGGRGDEFIQGTIRQFQQLATEWEKDGGVATSLREKIKDLQTQLSANTEQKLDDRYAAYLNGNITSTEGIQHLMNDYKALRTELENSRTYVGQFDDRITQLDTHLKNNTFEKREDDLRAMRNTISTLTDEGLQTLINKYRQLIEEENAVGRSTKELVKDFDFLKSVMAGKEEENLMKRFDQYLNGGLTSKEGIQKLINDFKNLRAELENTGNYTGQFESQIETLGKQQSADAFKERVKTTKEELINLKRVAGEMSDRELTNLINKYQSLITELKAAGEPTKMLTKQMEQLQQLQQTKSEQGLGERYLKAMTTGMSNEGLQQLINDMQKFDTNLETSVGGVAKFKTEIDDLKNKLKDAKAGDAFADGISAFTELQSGANLSIGRMKELIDILKKYRETLSKNDMYDPMGIVDTDRQIAKLEEKVKSTMPKVKQEMSFADAVRTIQDPMKMGTEEFSKAMKVAEEGMKNLKAHGHEAWKSISASIDDAKTRQADFNRETKLESMNTKLDNGVSNMSSKELDEQLKFWQNYKKEVRLSHDELEEVEKKIKDIKHEQQVNTNRSLSDTYSMLGLDRDLKKSVGTLSSANLSGMNTAELKEMQSLLTKFKENIGTGDDAFLKLVNSDLTAISSQLDKTKANYMSFEEALNISASATKTKEVSTDVINPVTGKTHKESSLVSDNDNTIEQMQNAKKVIEEYRNKVVKANETLGEFAARNANTIPQDVINKFGSESKAIEVFNQQITNLDHQISTVGKKNNFIGTAEDIKSMDTAAQTSAEALKKLVNAGNFSKEQLEQYRKTIIETLDKEKLTEEQRERLTIKTRNLDEVIKGLTSTEKHHISTLENAVDRLKNYVMVYVGFQQAVDEVRQELSKNFELSDEMANIQKVTKMTTQQVSELSEALVELDSRTSHSELMKLAYQGGKMGIGAEASSQEQQVEQLASFTKTANMMNMALGEDFGGQQAIAALAKLTKVMHVQQQENVNFSDAMTKTAAAILELGNNSIASYQKIQTFSTRLGGVAMSAKLAMPELLAIGSTLDTFGAQSEMAATAMSKILVQISKEPEKVAKAVGASVEEMQKLVWNGKTMEALQLMFDSLKQNGASLADIGEKMKDLVGGGGHNARALMVLTEMANGADTLRQHLEWSQKAFEANLNVQLEYYRMNNTAAAALERIKNAWVEAFANPTTAGYFNQFFNWLADFDYGIVKGIAQTDNLKTRILFALAAIWVAVKSYSLKTTTLFTRNVWAWIALAGNVFKAIASIKVALKGLMSATIWMMAVQVAFQGLAWVAGKVWDVFSGLYNFMMGTSSTIENIKNSLKEGWGRAISEVEGKVKLLTRDLEGLRKAEESLKESEDNIADKNKLITSTESYRTLVKKLNAEYTDYIGYIMSEAAAYNEVAAAIDVVNAKLREKATQESLQEAYSKADEKYPDLAKNFYGIIMDIQDNGHGYSQEFAAVFMQNVQQAIGEELAKGTSLNDLVITSDNIPAFLTQARDDAAAKTGQKITDNKIFFSEDKYNAYVEYFAKRQEYIDQMTTFFGNQLKIDEKNTKAATQRLIEDRKSEANKYKNLYENAVSANNTGDIKKYRKLYLKAMQDYSALFEQNMNLFSDDVIETMQGTYMTFADSIYKINKEANQDRFKNLNSQSGKEIAANQKTLNEYWKEVVEPDGTNLSEVWRSLQDYNEETGNNFKSYYEARDWTDKTIKEMQKLQKEKDLNLSGSWDLKDGGKDKWKQEAKDQYNAYLKELDDFYVKEQIKIDKARAKGDISQITYQHKTEQLEREHLDNRSKLRNMFLEGTEKYNEEYSKLTVESIRKIYNKENDEFTKEFEKTRKLIQKLGDSFVDEILLKSDQDQVTILKKWTDAQNKLESALLEGNPMKKVLADMKKSFDEMHLYFGSKDWALGNDHSEEELAVRQNTLESFLGRIGSMTEDEFKRELAATKLFANLTTEEIQVMYDKLLTIRDQYDEAARKQAKNDLKLMDNRMESGQWYEEMLQKVKGNAQLETYFSQRQNDGNGVSYQKGLDARIESLKATLKQEEQMKSIGASNDVRIAKLQIKISTEVLKKDHETLMARKTMFTQQRVALENEITEERKLLKEAQGGGNDAEAQHWMTEIGKLSMRLNATKQMEEEALKSLNEQILQAETEFIDKQAALFAQHSNSVKGYTDAIQSSLQEAFNTAIFKDEASKNALALAEWQEQQARESLAGVDYSRWANSELPQALQKSKYAIIQNGEVLRTEMLTPLEKLKMEQEEAWKTTKMEAWKKAIQGVADKVNESINNALQRFTAERDMASIEARKNRIVETYQKISLELQKAQDKAATDEMTNYRRVEWKKFQEEMKGEAAQSEFSIKNASVDSNTAATEANTEALNKMTAAVGGEGSNAASGTPEGGSEGNEYNPYAERDAELQTTGTEDIVNRGYSDFSANDGAVSFSESIEQLQTTRTLWQDITSSLAESSNLFNEAFNAFSNSTLNATEKWEMFGIQVAAKLVSSISGPLMNRAMEDMLSGLGIGGSISGQNSENVKAAKQAAKEMLAIQKSTDATSIAMTQNKANTETAIASREAAAETAIDSTVTKQKITNDATEIGSGGSAAIANVGTSAAEAGATVPLDTAKGIAKLWAKLGPWAPVVIAVMTAGIGAALGYAMSKVAGAKSEIASISGASGAASGKLATGMLTYAEGRYANDNDDANVNSSAQSDAYSNLTYKPGSTYSVHGNDGVDYSAKFEGRNLSTGLRKGEHFGIFSEKQPEMVISGPTTQKLLNDYPGLYNQIMAIDRGQNPMAAIDFNYVMKQIEGMNLTRTMGMTNMAKGMPTFAVGTNPTGGEYVDMGDSDSDGYSENGNSPRSTLNSQQGELNATLGMLNAVLSQMMEQGVHSNIVMSGRNGMDEQQKKYERFKKRMGLN